MTQLFFQSFCTKKWPNFFSNLFALKSKKTLGPVPLIVIFYQCWTKMTFWKKKRAKICSKLQKILRFLKIPGKKLGALPRSNTCRRVEGGGWRVEAKLVRSVLLLFFQSFCTKKWPNFFFNLFALKNGPTFFSIFLH